MEIFFTILILILLVSISGLLSRIFSFQIPLPLVQILLGALLAWPQFGLHVDFNPELFLVLFIPPLLFSDGWKTPIREFLRHGSEIVILALVLVIITVVGIGYLIYWMIPGMPLVAALALAAVLSPTDAVALSGIVGDGRIPKKLMDILQGEALMNDASGLVSLKFSIAVAMGTMVFTIGAASLDFLKVAAGGLLAGIIVTWIYSKSLRFIFQLSHGDFATQTILLLLLPFAAYLIAEHINVSGILAAVTSGMTIGQSSIIRHAPLSMRLRGNSVWAMLEFVFNGMVFILLGLQLPDILLSSILQAEFDPNINIWMLVTYVILIYSALIILRFCWLIFMKRITLQFMSKCPMVFSEYSIREILIVSFAGVRGAITLAGVLSIPLFLSDGSVFPARYQLVFIATGVILLSLLCGVVILPILLEGIVVSDKSLQLKEERMARTIAAEVAIESLHKMEERLINSHEENIDIQIFNEVSARIIGNLRRRINNTDNIEHIMLIEDLERRMRLNALHAERGEYYHLRAQQKISNETLTKLLRDLDFLEALLVGDE
ncbi:Na+/H+ antiporter [Blochmannia endosymbiont of Polyrhachis (Hedomyrma) turneri]|uniref:Na+/H+ antiporter n=1 Tax=Blochmannia endosymbiont of Polyrhachis (Hedomyrma) turneri TaxID=1505596 RepID=UPI00061A5359|nr:Na+/H+ antiporter [Blochmannia endosymbiont of Polyrhachis (Hedomyrma) turneri]AKC59626.1 putative Na(+)/H(+) exchanger yjcE [Blochmannia endosymbiont of Polyrhachis (Hedomyrma) turneri]